jgi:hypothetical protein
MGLFRFILEPYDGMKSRYTCPACNKKHVFTRYLDTETGELLADHVGRCSREIKCGYHYPPRKYFYDNKGSFKVVGRSPGAHKTKLWPDPGQVVPTFIHQDIYHDSLSNYNKNPFCSFLGGVFGKEITNMLITKYAIGTSILWGGSTVFWQKDTNGDVRTGKIMDYNSKTGRRIKEIGPEGTEMSHITWVHDILKKKGLIKEFVLQQCFFGEHLLTSSHCQPVAIVESEKTAIICSVYFPEFVWLACGSLNGLSSGKLKILKDRKIVLFPDLGCQESWEKMATEIARDIPCKIVVSDFLEEKASPEDKMNGLDLADFLVIRDEKFGWALNERRYPMFWDSVSQEDVK